MVDQQPPEPVIEQSDAFTLSDEQLDTAKLLDLLLGTSIADRYIDFCRLSAGNFGLRVSSPMAAHALRELDSILRETLATPMGAQIETALTSKQAKEARKALRALGHDAQAIDRAIDKLGPRVNHTEQIIKIVTRLGLAADSDVAKAWISVSRSSRKAHERRFDRALKVDDVFRDEWAKPFDNVVRGIAVALQGSYTALLKRVDALIAMENKAKAIKLYQKEIPGALSLQWHFFRSLKDPAWLPHLIRENLIVEPQARTEEQKNGTIRFRDWPLGAYLLEIAKSDNAQARALVAEALRSLAGTTNPDVRRDGVEILAALPATDAAQLSDIAEAWLSGDNFFFGLHHAEALLNRLAKAKELDACFKVAKALLRLSERDGRLATLYSHHMYEHSLPKTSDIITKAFGVRALELLNGLLYQAALLSDKIRVDPPGDYTSVVLESFSQDGGHTYDVFGALVVAVRRCGCYLIEQPEADAPAIMAILTTHKFKIFKRLALHVLSKKPQAAPQIADDLLFDVGSLDSYNLRHEYSELALAWFSHMNADRQTALLDLVDGLPAKHAEQWKERFLEHEKREPNEEDIRTYTAAVTRDASWYWRAALPADRRQALEDIVKTIGDPDAWKNRFNGEDDKSPMSAADFVVKSAEDIANYLRTWAPGKRPKETKTALGMQLYTAVQADPAKFASGAGFFADLAPVYVRRLFEGLRNPIQNKGKIDWQPTLQLLESVLSITESPKPGEVSTGGDDPSWFWAAKEGAQLLRSGLQQGKEGPGYLNAPNIGRIIAAVEKVAPTSPETEDFEDSFRRNPYFSAENTMLGLATDLRVLELFWLSKHESSPIFATPRDALETQSTFDDFAQRVFELDGPNGRIVRAVLGRYLSWLMYFGTSWVKTNLARLFPAAQDLSDAAWVAHLMNDQGPIGALMAEMVPQYDREIERLTLDRPEDEKDWRQDRLGEYVIIEYLWGYLPGELLSAFCEKAPARLRQHVMWFIGRDLKKSPETMDAAVRKRALDYWEMRLAAGEAAKNKDAFRTELGSIGLWLGNTTLETQWLLDQQLKMLRAGFAPTEAYAVVEWASSIAPEFPDGAVALIEELFKNPNIDQWAYTTQQPVVRGILTAGLASARQETKAAVERTISFLATRGEHSFLDLSQNE